MTLSRNMNGRHGDMWRTVDRAAAEARTYPHWKRGHSVLPKQTTIPVHPALATKTALDTLTHYIAPGGTVFGSGPCGSVSVERLPSKHVSRPSFGDVCAFAEWQGNR